MSVAVDTTRLEDLPQDALITILGFLSISEWSTLAVTSKLLRRAVQDDSLWQGLALAKWGPSVSTLAAHRIPAGQWRAFCCRRLASVLPPRRSPLDLVQEQFTCPWTHIACCLLCSRTSGGTTIRNAMLSFLHTWPTPSAVLTAPDADILAALRPLGLQAHRLAALRNMSRDFLATDWEDPTAFNGCGRFTADSWRIFCRGLRDPKKVLDVNLAKYLRWLADEEYVNVVRKGKAKRAFVAQLRKREVAGKDRAGTEEERAAKKRRTVEEVEGGRRQTRSASRAGGSGQPGRCGNQKVAAALKTGSRLRA